MDVTHKMLQAIINGQAALKQELMAEINKVGSRVDKLGDKLDSMGQKLSEVEKNLTKRIDRLGRQLAYLEDDAPTREERDQLEKRVRKLERKFEPDL